MEYLLRAPRNVRAVGAPRSGGEGLTRRAQREQEAILALQRVAGNAAVAHLFAAESGQAAPGQRLVEHAGSPAAVREAASSTPGFPTFGVPQGKSLSEVKTLVEGTGRKINEGEWILGFTTRPRSYQVPSYLVQYGRTGPTAWDHWFADVTLVAEADEGTCDVYYAVEGEYDTGKKTKGMPIHAIISAGMSASARAAELEHVADYRYAYSITLAKAARVIAALAGAAEKDGVRAATYQPVEGGAAGLGVVRPELDRILALNLDAFLRPLTHDQTAWANRYEDRINRTGRRDALRWHTHGDGGLQPTDGTKMVYYVNAGSTQIDTDNPGSNSPQVVDFGSTV